MKKLITLSLAFMALVGLAACNDDNDTFYVSSSGEGTITIDYDVPIYLGRLVLFSSPSEQEFFLMGGVAYVNADGNFGGRGAAVSFTLPNFDEANTLTAQNYNIDNQEYMVGYAETLNFDGDVESEDYNYLTSGTVVIRQSGSLYDIKVLGTDSDDNSVIINYRGYIYRSFVAEVEEE